MLFQTSMTFSYVKYKYDISRNIFSVHEIEVNGHQNQHSSKYLFFFSFIYTFKLYLSICVDDKHSRIHMLLRVCFPLAMLILPSIIILMIMLNDYV